VAAVPSFPELPEPLEDGSVKVRVAAERDIPEVLIAYQDDPELHRRLGELRPPSGAELGRRSENAEADRIAGRNLTMTIVESEDDTCRGQISVHHVDWENGRAELGIWVALGRRGRELGRRSLSLVGGWLLSDGGLERVEILTHPANRRMIAAAEGAGFAFEGVLRANRLRRGERVDEAVLSLVRRDLRS
jgi:[ribosomal protein S5]-alanine N-acetyltransferase